MRPRGRQEEGKVPASFPGKARKIFLKVLPDLKNKDFLVYFVATERFFSRGLRPCQQKLEKFFGEVNGQQRTEIFAYRTLGC